jgi:hypothetical protein
MEKLVIIEQTCLLEEKFSKNGVQKNVHVVVKNNPFMVTLALMDKHINFHRVSVDVQLVYDCSSLKEVDFVKLKPMDFKTKPNDEGDQLSVEIRIKVLTSQLEDMFFRVKITLVDPRTHKELPNLSAITHPIRVVSKPDQVKKKVKKRKRAPTDNLMDMLGRIEAQQREQQRMLKKLCVVPASPATGLVDSNTGADGFHLAFTEFLAAFKQIAAVDDGSYKVNTSTQDAQTMCEILDLIRMELKKSVHSFTSPLSPPHPAAMASIPSASTTLCTCENCPYRDSKLDKVNMGLFSPVIDSSIDNSHPTPQSSTSLPDMMNQLPTFPSFNPFPDLGNIFAQ